MGKNKKKKDKTKFASVSDETNRPRIKAKKKPMGFEKFVLDKSGAVAKEIAVFDPSSVERALDSLPGPDALARAADRLQALGHPSRLQTLLALQSNELCVGDVAAILGLSLSATSTMLKNLRSLGFVSVRHAGKQTYYKIASTLPKVVLDACFRADAA